MADDKEVETYGDRVRNMVADVTMDVRSEIKQLAARAEEAGADRVKMDIMGVVQLTIKHMGRRGFIK